MPPKKAATASKAVDPEKLTVPKLKAELKKLGLDTDGLKAVLVLQRRLHGLLMAAAVARAAARAAKRSACVARHKAKKRLHAEIFGDSDSDCPESASSASDDSD